MFEMQGIRKLRVAQFKELIQKHGLRAIVISGTENFQFFTNIQLSSHYWERPFALVIPADGEPFALVNMVSENGVMMQVERQSSWISNLSFYSELPRMQDRTYTLGQFTRMLQEKLEAAGLDAGQIGYDSKTPHLASWQRRCRVFTFQRIVGTEATALGEASGRNRHSAGRGHARGLGHQQAPGQPQTRPRPAGIERARNRRCHGGSGSALSRIEFPGLKLLTLSGPASSSTDGDGAPTGATIDANSPIVSVIVPRMNGYSVEVHRTYSAEAERRAEGAVRRPPSNSTKAPSARHTRGTCVSKIDEVVHAAALKAGHYSYLVHRAGHGIGISTHEYPEDVPVNPRSIEENEVFSA